MANRKKKVFVALSGGVDSSTAAALLVQEGFDCSAVFMVTCDHAQHTQADAEMVAEKLGIKFCVLDLRRDFERIIEYFCREYRSGRTPNPCVVCNRDIKFGRLLQFAREKSADFLATGHYARVLKKHGTIGLYQAIDVAKDQSYALAMINKNILPFIIFPVGSYTKDKTRQMAVQFGLETVKKPESQEICFIPDNDYAALLEGKCPELVRNGNIVDGSGKVLGRHDGVHRFTIGQRRGLRIAMGRPWYVVRIDAATNTVVLGPKQDVMKNKLYATGINWLTTKPQSSFRAKVKIRYNDRGSPASILAQGSGALVEFEQPVSAVTPGQLAVFYSDQQLDARVIGAGWIDNR